eukprot:gb/GEZJ01005726.1/.p1 GENE.gb/GEZJ01005726.1/~~gb/GEZJ01005726.1/.p1  ORF type:complete len:108 (+),score=3.14 gb/GEZJ01005726.1/:591-914(+)
MSRLRTSNSVQYSSDHIDPNTGLPKRPHVREAIACPVRLYDVGRLVCPEADPTSGYTESLVRGDYCKLDWELAAVSPPSRASIADSAKFLPKRDLYRVTEQILIKTK